jgi:hypothetical protein
MKQNFLYIVVYIRFLLFFQPVKAKKITVTPAEVEPCIQPDKLGNTHYFVITDNVVNGIRKLENRFFLKIKIPVIYSFTVLIILKTIC